MTDETVLMVDTVGNSAGNIPPGTPKVAGYNTGSNGIEWTSADWARFPNAGKVIICQDADYSTWETADVGDVEKGAMTIDGFVNGATKRQARGWNTCAYIDKADVATLVKACNAAKLTKVELWIGDWDLNQEQAASQLGQTVGGYEVVAIQWASPTSNPNTIVPGGSKTLKQANLDLSVTLPAWFAGPTNAKPVQPPVVPPVTTPTPPPVTTPPTDTTIYGFLIIPPTDHDSTSDVPCKAVTSNDGGKTWE